jgi:hypothetical protein
MSSQKTGDAISPLDIAAGDLIEVTDLDHARMRVDKVLWGHSSKGRPVSVTFLDEARRGTSANIHVPWESAILRLSED